MSIGLIGTKIGMTREFMKSGQSVPVTVIKVEKGRVLGVITKEKRGYNAIQVGFGKIKNSKLTKQMKGFFAKKSTEPKKMSLPGIGLSAPLGENTFARKKDSPGPKTSGGTMGAVYGHDSKNPSATNRKGSTNTEDALQKLGI